MKYYYANAQNQPTGPLDLDGLAALSRAGTITDQTNVIAEGSQTWTSYGLVRTGATSAAIADALAAKVSRATEAARSFSWGEMLFGMLLVVISNLVLPWTLLKHAADELTQWGKERLVPSATSDLPALTQTLVVARPMAHVVFTVIMVIFAVLALFGTGLMYHLPLTVEDALGRQYEAQYSFGHALGTSVVALLFAYFGNLFIGLIYEAGGLLVRIANDIRRLASR